MTFRIEFINQSHAIDRSPMPAQLGHLYTSETWNHFCNQVDSPLKVLHTVERNAKKLTRGVGSILLLLIAAILACTLFPFPFFSQQIGVIVSVVLFVIGCIMEYTVLYCRVPTAQSKAWKEVNAVLVEESNAKKTVSFHLKHDLIQEIDGRVDSHGGHIYTRNRYEPYIVCNPVNFTVPLGGADTFHTNPNSIPVNHTEANKTVKERLAELDEVKELFSNEEYERKKKSILDSI